MVGLHLRNTSYDTPKCNLCPSIGVKYISIILINKKPVQINNDFENEDNNIL